MVMVPSALSDQLLISIYLRRDKHENGMTLQEYADGVIAGTHTPLDHDAFVYQFGTIEEEVTLVENWAVANGLTIVESGRGTATVKVVGTVEQFNNIFNITLQTATDDERTFYTHDGDITVPSEINDVVELVAGLDNSITFKHNAILDPADYQGDLDPNLISSPSPIDLAKAYGFPRSPGTDQSQGYGACVAIIELGGGWTAQNLTSTFSRIGLENPTVVDVSVDGGVNDGGVDTNSSGEVMLDIYCVGAVCPKAKIAMYFAPNSFQGFIDTIVSPTNDTVNNPSVISISWGTYEGYWGSSYRNAFESALQSAIVKGITVFAAIGDYGTQSISGGGTYTVQYPGVSRYLVSCGGTIISINNDYSIASEVVWKTGSSYATGGGVSTIYSMPSWQTGKGYSTKTYPGGVVTSLAARGVPDISAMATGYRIWYGSPNYTGSFLGTSAVAPLLAGMMARLNLLTGRRIGFVNADWYDFSATVSRDITTGNNAAPASVGYSATSGWDACTGLGVPDGAGLYKLYKVGTTFPKSNNGFRPTNGQTYPRRINSIR